MGNDQKRAVLAVAISAVILFLWQFFIVPKYQPSHNSPTEVSTTTTTPQPATEPNKVETNTPAAPITAVSMAKVKLANGNEYEISDTLVLKNIHQPKDINFKEFVGSDNPIEIYEIQNQKQVLSQYNLTFSENSNVITGISKVDGSQVKIEINDNGFIKYTINSVTPKKYRIIFNSSKKVLENKQERKFSILHKKLYTEIVGKTDSGENTLKWFGLDFNYHLLAAVVQNEEPILFRVYAEADNG
ncbi:MAG: hypothetical protein U0T83_05115 [Bacteriovoracaceae bacterium]